MIIELKSIDCIAENERHGRVIRVRRPQHGPEPWVHFDRRHTGDSIRHDHAMPREIYGTWGARGLTAYMLGFIIVSGGTYLLLARGLDVEKEAAAVLESENVRPEVA